jgi:hypothetical protein
MPQKGRRKGEYKDDRIGQKLRLRLLEEEGDWQRFEIVDTGVKFWFHSKKGRYYRERGGEQISPASLAASVNDGNTGVPPLDPRLASSRSEGPSDEPSPTAPEESLIPSAVSISPDLAGEVPFEWITLTVIPEDQEQERPKLWTFILKDKSGNEVWKILHLSHDEVKKYLNDEEIISRVPHATADPEPGTSAPSPTIFFQQEPRLKDALATEYGRFKAATQADAATVTASARANLRQGEEATAVGYRQSDILDRIKQYHAAMAEKSPGHSSVQMTRIPLCTALLLRVGGEDRKITHLYTQVGNAQELRCYLGNATEEQDGVYQRVHTSITSDGTAHTMVQTGKNVAVPGLEAAVSHERDAPGTRVGFDSEEQRDKDGKLLGFAARTLRERPQNLCHAKTKHRDWVIRGQKWSELAERDRKGAELLAKRFNAVLDSAIAAIMEDRTVKRLRPEFKTLDREWTFPSQTATAGEEWDDARASKIVHERMLD